MVPLSLGVGALLVPARGALRWASGVTRGAAALIALSLLGLAWGGPLVSFVRLDAPGAVMLGLVALLGVVVSRFSVSYLDGEPGLQRYARALLATLSAVTSLLITNNLALMALAWVATSISLHQLLTFYPDRRPALLAAHKKFILSRLADACLAVAVGLLGVQAGTLELDGLSQAVTSRPVLEPLWGAAAVLVAAWRRDHGG
jgi:NAD(P)H-quinone oxidoreductase subunit 5